MCWADDNNNAVKKRSRLLVILLCNARRFMIINGEREKCATSLA